MIIANVAVDRVTARVISCETIPRGIIGARVKLEFPDPAWETLTKTVVFRGAQTRNAVLTGDTVTIPWETVAQAGKKLYLGVYGVGEAGKLEIPTVWADLGYITGAASPGEQEVYHTPVPPQRHNQNCLCECYSFSKCSALFLPKKLRSSTTATVPSLRRSST